MIKLSEYARLLVENDLTPDAFDRKIKAAVETIFDVDNVRVKNQKKFQLLQLQIHISIALCILLTETFRST